MSNLANQKQSGTKTLQVSPIRQRKVLQKTFKANKEIMTDMFSQYGNSSNANNVTTLYDNFPKTHTMS